MNVELNGKTMLMKNWILQNDKEDASFGIFWKLFVGIWIMNFDFGLYNNFDSIFIKTN